MFELLTKEQFTMNTLNEDLQTTEKYSQDYHNIVTHNMLIFSAD